ncbi:hypothetical protein CW711_01475 [Candidatus Bathyarchaeota archaeon]|nr:MAG: hypothetical protein B6U84_04530 [Candidatus Bathyarchaeota archaeon ex4484_40]RJS79968.1 MAG: hypothetical protein CW711_01475 [Candidatus Bathyarchaeota archaeon]RLG96862.1 MAG: hypothetical protein DRO29_04010 [Candidatus Bathyarchaeota archaeon]
MKVPKVRMLQGKVVKVERTGEYMFDKDGDRWEKCIFTVELTGFSKRTPDEILPENLRGKRIKLVRYCCFDWHYKLGVRKTLEPDETEAILKGESTETAYF